MNGRTVATVLISAGCGVVTGVFLAWGEATSTAQIKARNRYDEQLAAHKRALNATRIGTVKSIVESPAGMEADLEINLSGDDLPLPDADDTIKVGGEMIVETPIATDYIEAAKKYGDPDAFITQAEDVGMSYIEAEEYEEEDGRAKEQITILIGGDDPVFMMDGEPIDNWSDLIGEMILVDFYRLLPGEGDRVLYVRNHKRDEDYEVIQVSP